MMFPSRSPHCTVNPKLSAAINEALLFKSADQRQRLGEKLTKLGVDEPSSLAQLSKQGFEQQLVSSSVFTNCVAEQGDALILQSHVKKSAQSEKDQERRGRGRSRTPKRRNYSRRHSTEKKSSYRASSIRGSEKKTRRSRSPSPSKSQLWRAVEDGDLAGVKQIIEEGGNPNETYKGWSPLMKAAESNYDQIVEELLNNGAELNATNRKGRSALSFAAAPSMKRPSALNALQFLLAKGASMEADKNGRSPKDWATHEKRDDSLAVIEDAMDKRD